MIMQPDLFVGVHRGIRHALFDTCLALGRADGMVTMELQTRLRAVLHFVHHHGENEDLLLLPLLATSAPRIHARMREAHAEIAIAHAALAAQVGDGSATELFHGACDFTARYLTHMREEELELETAIRAAVPPDELAAFPRGSVARTPPEDARAMLGWMLPAMPPGDGRALLASLPEPLRQALESLVLTPVA